MNFAKHSELKDMHAFLSPSKYHWMNYSDEKLDETYVKWRAIEMGTKLHEFAAQAIRLKVRMPRSKKTLYNYINDAIGYRMTPEQPLWYSENCFGTADAISFYDDFLRIHDLKTGTTKASIHQLEVYAAIFCLEYHIKPESIQNELRIYQNDDILIQNTEPSIIHQVMDTIVRFDRRIEKMKGG